jgi:hypothetical protein
VVVYVCKGMFLGVRACVCISKCLWGVCVNVCVCVCSSLSTNGHVLFDLFDIVSHSAIKFFSPFIIIFTFTYMCIHFAINVFI